MSHARFVQDWLEGWNSRNLDQLMAHYSTDATFQSPSVVSLIPRSNGIVEGRDAIRDLYARALASFPKLRFEVEDVIEREALVIVIYRKLNVFSEEPGLTVETFEFRDGLVTRNIVYWGFEEVASRFRPRAP